jgi:hypothetical protein
MFRSADKNVGRKQCQQPATRRKCRTNSARIAASVVASLRERRIDANQQCQPERAVLRAGLAFGECGYALRKTPLSVECAITLIRPPRKPQTLSIQGFAANSSGQAITLIRVRYGRRIPAQADNLRTPAGLRQTQQHPLSTQYLPRNNSPTPDRIHQPFLRLPKCQRAQVPRSYNCIQTNTYVKQVHLEA